MKRLPIVAVLILALAVTAGCDVSHLAQPSATSTEWNATRQQVQQLLTRVTVVPVRPDTPGYDRSCGTGHACVFGPSWTDDTSAPGGHNGCGQRDDILASQLRDVAYKPGSRCVVVAGTLSPDPYTGTDITFTKANASNVQIDHIYPLSAAWDMGANTWNHDKRVHFANDTSTELRAVDGKTNQSKSDKTPSQWMPPNRGFHCQYAYLYLRVAVTYQLPVTQQDKDALVRAGATCPAGAQPSAKPK